LESENRKGERDGLSRLPAVDQGGLMNGGGQKKALNGALGRFPVSHDAVRRIQDMIASGSISPGEN
jgi:hypothetical protein